MDSAQCVPIPNIARQYLVWLSGYPECQQGLDSERSRSGKLGALAQRLQARLQPPIAYRGDGGNVVVYDTRPEAEDAAVAITATNKNSSSSFTVTEFQPL